MSTFTLRNDDLVGVLRGIQKEKENERDEYMMKPSLRGFSLGE